VGSSLRLEGIRVTRNIIKLKTTKDENLPFKEIISEVAKLAAEKLDKVRFEAWLCLEDYWKNRNDFPPLESTFSHLADITSIVYCSQILKLVEIDWLRANVIQGMASSAVAGTEDQGRAARAAVVSYLQEQTAKGAPGSQVTFLGTLVDLLRTSLSEDRVVGPRMELLAFLIEQGFYTDLVESRLAKERVDLVELGQKFYSPSASFARVEMLLTFYSALSSLDKYRKRALEKMTKMLLHRYSKVC